MSEKQIYPEGYVVLPLGVYENLKYKASQYDIAKSQGQLERLLPPETLQKDLLIIKSEGKSQKEPSKSENEVSPAPLKEIEQPKRGRKPVDHGKVNALYNAGWKIEDIAKEMGLSTATIYMHVEHLRRDKKHDN